MKERFSPKNIAKTALILTVTLILSYVENLIPWSFSVPGVKIGLANIGIVFALYRLGAAEGAVISLLRVAIISVLFGTGLSFLYALSGAVFSYGLMLLLKKLKFALPTVSVCGGVAHNLAQVLTAMLLLSLKELVLYLPVLIASGIVAGLIIGILSAILVKRIPENII